MIYADTTVLTTRIFGEAEQVAAIEGLLADQRVCTCRYVVQEFRCNFLKDCVLLHSLLLDSPTTTEAVRRMSNKYRSGRQRGDTLQILMLLLDLNDGHLPRDRAIDQLERFIVGQLVDWFLDPVSEKSVVDSTGCARSSGEPLRVGNTYSLACRCSKDEAPKCEIMAFYGKHRSEFEILLNGPRELDKVAKNFRETIRGALADPNNGRGNACSVVLADAIIVLEAPPGAEVCSTNAKHFEPICRTLGKSFRDARVNATPNGPS